MFLSGLQEIFTAFFCPAFPPLPWHPTASQMPCPVYVTQSLEHKGLHKNVSSHHSHIGFGVVELPECSVPIPFVSSVLSDTSTLHSFCWSSSQPLGLKCWEQEEGRSNSSGVMRSYFHYSRFFPGLSFPFNCAGAIGFAWAPSILPRYPHLTQAGDGRLASYDLKCEWCVTRAEFKQVLLFISNAQGAVSKQLISIPILLLFRKGRQHIPQEQKSIFSCHLNTNNKEIPVP